MSTNKSEHYGLHLWAPEDSFVRTEFNENSEKLDGVLHTAAEQAERALAGLEPLGFNVYNLMLQNYYDGKYGGYKKALIFDDFANGDLISTMGKGVAVGDHVLTFTRPAVRQAAAPRAGELTPAPGDVHAIVVGKNPGVMPACKGVMGWARYEGGLPELFIRRSYRDRSLAPLESRTTVDFQGRSCTELAFRLDMALEEGITMPVLRLNLFPGENQMKLYDFALMLI